MIKNYFPENIEYLNKQSKLSQDDFGQLFDIGKGLISGYINGRSFPKIETLIKICDHFKISLDDLIRTSLLQKKYQDRSNEKPVTIGEPPEGYGFISLKYVELLEKSNEDKDKLIVAYEKRLGVKKDTA